MHVPIDATKARVGLCSRYQLTGDTSGTYHVFRPEKARGRRQSAGVVKQIFVSEVAKQELRDQVP
jgi:hypothetical protein